MTTLCQETAAHEVEREREEDGDEAEDDSQAPPGSVAGIAADQSPCDVGYRRERRDPAEFLHCGREGTQREEDTAEEEHGGNEQGEEVVERVD